jgi:hypothetical protein
MLKVQVDALFRGWYAIGISDALISSFKLEDTKLRIGIQGVREEYLE